MTDKNRNGKHFLGIAVFIAVTFLLSLTTIRVFAASQASPTVTVSSSGANMIKVSWTSVSGASSYNVYRCDKTAPYQKIASTSSTSYVDYSVQNDTPYEYSVTAVVNGEETPFNSKGALGYTAYKAAHIYNWQVKDLTPWSFTVSGKVSYAGTASYICLPVWTEANGHDDLRWYTVPVSNNSFSYTIYTSNHGSQRGVYVLDPYLNGQSIYCQAPLWVEVPVGQITITSPEVVNLSADGFTATAIATAFNNHVKTVKAEIWTAYNGTDDLETVTASYDSATGIISCPVDVTKHNNEAKIYYVRFTVTDGVGGSKSLLMRAYVPTTQKCMSLTVIDLGEGNIGGSSTLLTSGGKGLLFDTGRSESADAVVTAIKQHGLLTIDIIITHGDGDHIGVAQAIIDAGISIGTVYTDQYPTDVMWDELDRRESMSVFKKYAKIKNIPATLTVGDATVTTIGPARHYSLYEARANGASMANANSYWFMITNGSRKVLINGDSELISSRDMAKSGTDISADIYILGHHGAAKTLDAEILKAISPQWTAASGRITSEISADTVSKLKSAGVPYYFTADYGSIDFSIRGSQVFINTAKNSFSPVTYYKVTWKNADGKTLETDSYVKQDSAPSYDGSTPKLSKTAQYSYTFTGWSTDCNTALTEFPAVTKNVTYTAVYKKTVNTYKITWKDADKTVLETSSVEYGIRPAYGGSTPTKAATAQYTYTFAGWSTDGKTVLTTIPKVTEAATYIAVYDRMVNSYKITWKDADKSVLLTSTLKYGATPKYTGSTPSKAATAQYSYAFAGWSTDGKTVLDSIPKVTGKATYIAVYKSTVRKYTITWKNADGSTLGTTKAAYGSVPEFGSEPQYPANDGGAYAFDGWTPELQKVTGTATYTATYTTSSPKLRRLYGSTRYETAGEILQDCFEDDSLDRIVLASGESYQYAITGIAYAGACNCPLLITKSSELSQAAREEISRLASDHCEVVIIGGKNAVSAAVEKALRQMDEVAVVTRIAADAAGAEEAAVEIYAEGMKEGLWTDSGTVIIVSGAVFADGISIAPYAYAAKTPILFTDENGELSKAAYNMLSKNSAAYAILAGGSSAVAGTIEKNLASEGVLCLRLAGSDRYRTSEKVFDWLIGGDESAAFQPEEPFTPAYVGFATGLSYADAVLSADLLGQKKSPILLVADKKAAIAVLFETLGGHENEIVLATIFGGTGSVSNNLAARIADAITEDPQ